MLMMMMIGHQRKEIIRDAYIAMKQQVVGRSSIHLVEEIASPLGMQRVYRVSYSL